jgi:hypothetical protein
LGGPGGRRKVTEIDSEESRMINGYMMLKTPLGPVKRVCNITHPFRTDERGFGRPKPPLSPTPRFVEIFVEISS